MAMTIMTRRRRMLLPGLVIAALGCDGPEPAEQPVDEGARGTQSAETAVPQGAHDGRMVLPLNVASEVDWDVFLEKVAWGRAQRLDTLPIGETMVRLGTSFVGTTYKPHTLEVAGPEKVVVNLRELDCVTFVENVLALSIAVRTLSDEVLADPSRYQPLYAELLARVRYRGGRLDGYASRLHYFSEWIHDNDARGVVLDLGESLGGVVDPEPIDFMSTHPEAYRQLGEGANLDEIRRIEGELGNRARYFLPEDLIAEAAHGIRNGDVIAATSTVEGLDIAHTGIAYWIDGELHLIHAPLVGEAVQISERTLADRILAIASQDGIMVARPVELGQGDTSRGHAAREPGTR